MTEFCYFINLINAFNHYENTYDRPIDLGIYWGKGITVFEWSSFLNISVYTWRHGRAATREVKWPVHRSKNLDSGFLAHNNNRDLICLQLTPGHMAMPENYSVGTMSCPRCVSSTVTGWYCSASEHYSSFWLWATVQKKKYVLWCVSSTITWWCCNTSQKKQ